MRKPHHTELAKKRCFVLDMDGTVYLGDKLLPGTKTFLAVLAEQNKDYLFVTNNSSRDRFYYARKLNRLGISMLPDKILTSGHATCRLLRRESPDLRLDIIGTEYLIREFEAAGFTIDEKRPDMVLLGFDRTLTYDKLIRLCDHVRAGLPYVATHPDYNCPVEKGYIPDVGAMMALVKASTGREPDRIVGKPNIDIIDAICAYTKRDREELAIIGDRLYTDIATGNNAGITSILVLSGESKEGDLADSPFMPDYVFNDIGELAEALKKTREE